MKHNIKFCLFLISLLFIFPVVVSAKEKLFSCKYDVIVIHESTDKNAQEEVTFPFTITMYDDESLAFDNGGHALKKGNNSFFYVDGKEYGSVALNINIKKENMKKDGKYFCPNLELNKSQPIAYTLKTGGGATIGDEYIATTGGAPIYHKQVDESEKLTVTKECSPFSYKSTSDKQQVILDYNFKLKLKMYSNGEKQMCLTSTEFVELCSETEKTDSLNVVYNDFSKTYSFIIKKDNLPDFFIQKTASELNNNEFQCPSQVYISAVNDNEYVFTTDFEEASEESDNITQLKPDSSDGDNQDDSDTSVGACETIPEPIKEYINQALKLIRWIGLAAMIILGVLDFTKAVASDDQDALKKAWGHFTKRLIAVIILFILPLLIDLIMDLVDITTCKL